VGLERQTRVTVSKKNAKGVLDPLRLSKLKDLGWECGGILVHAMYLNRSGSHFVVYLYIFVFAIILFK
jgi:hypothetical protein